MAVSLLSYEISDICVGKPAVRSLPVTAKINEALAVLKKTEENYLSVWSCDHEKKIDLAECRCIGKVGMVDIVLYLCQETNRLDPVSALQSKIALLLSDNPCQVRHVEPHISLLDALDLMLEGAQNLIVPIMTRQRKPLRKHFSHVNGREFCCLTQEDIVRFLLNRIGLFSPIPALSIESLGIVKTEVPSIMYQAPISCALEAIAVAHAEQTSVAVITPDGTLVGEISPSTLAVCDDTVACALITLSAGDLMAYIDCGGPPEHLVRAIKTNLRDENLEGLLELMGDSSSSEDEELASGELSPTGPFFTSRLMRTTRRAEPIICQKRSSLVAVMFQALAHRVTYVWVVDDDCTLLGIVTFSDILKVFHEQL